MPTKRPHLSEEDERLDRLALEARSEYSLNTSKAKGSYDVADSDEKARLQVHRKFIIAVCGLAIVLVTVFGYMGYAYWHRGATSKRQAEAGEKERIRLITLTTETTAEVKRLVAHQDLSEAVFVLNASLPKGLPTDVRDVLTEEIKGAFISQTRSNVEGLLAKNDFAGASTALNEPAPITLSDEFRLQLESRTTTAALAHRSHLLDEVDGEIQRRSPDAARKLLDQVRALNTYGAKDPRVPGLVGAIGRLEKEKELEPGRRLLARSREAAAKGKWEEARVLIIEARGMPHKGNDLEDWDKELGGKVRGRILITGTPAAALVKVLAHDPTPVGTALAGLPPGLIEVFIEAEGYIPTKLDIDVPNYPGVSQVAVDLKPEAPGPVWAVHALAGRSAQQLAVNIYRNGYGNAAWIDAMDRIADQSLPRPTPKRSRKSKKNLATLTQDARREFLANTTDAVHALSALAEFTAAHPRSLETILDRCGKEIGIRLRTVEQGCAVCLGRGKLECSACGGAGERTESRPCPTCTGSGRVPHEACDGTGIVQCRRCKGTGKVEETTIVRRNGEAVPKTKLVTCSKCDGKGTVRCRCGKGFVACGDCKKTGKRVLPGPCLACEGHGYNACDICQSDGRRKKMDIEKRRKVEDEIAAITDSRP